MARGSVILLASSTLVVIASAAAITAAPAMPTNTPSPTTFNPVFAYSPTMIWGNKVTPVPLLMKCMEQRYHEICLEDLKEPYIDFPKMSRCAHQVMESCGGYINLGDAAEKSSKTLYRDMIESVLPNLVYEDGKIVISELDKVKVIAVLVRHGLITVPEKDRGKGKIFLYKEGEDKIIAQLEEMGIVKMVHKEGKRMVEAHMGNEQATVRTDHEEADNGIELVVGNRTWFS